MNKLEYNNFLENAFQVVDFLNDNNFYFDNFYEKNQKINQKQLSAFLSANPDKNFYYEVTDQMEKITSAWNEVIL